MDNNYHQELLTNQVHKFYDKANEVYGLSLAYPLIDFSLKGTTAGQAIAGRNTIRLNLTAIQAEGGWDHLYNHTVPHEVAHIFQRLNPDWPKGRKANKSHGVYWQRVMRVFGVEAKRCHSLDLPKSRVQAKWDYSCGCQTWELSTTRHNKIRRGRTYHCRKCKKDLTIVN
jgi:SprT protein